MLLLPYHGLVRWSIFRTDASSPIHPTPPGRKDTAQIETMWCKKLHHRLRWIAKRSLSTLQVEPSECFAASSMTCNIIINSVTKWSRLKKAEPRIDFTHCSFKEACWGPVWIFPTLIIGQPNSLKWDSLYRLECTLLTRLTRVVHCYKPYI